MDAAAFERSRQGSFEMRSAPRVATALAAQLKIAHIAGNLSCQLRDIGLGGVCVETPSPIGLPDVREIYLPLPSGPLSIEVVGCWQRPAPFEHSILTGMQFRKLSQDKQKQIREFVQHSLVTLTNFLQDGSELGELDYDLLTDVALFSRLRHAPTGAHLCLEGEGQEGSESMFVIREGRVNLVAGRPPRRVQLESVSAGGVFGGLGLIARLPHPLTAIAAQEVTLLEIDAQAYRYLEQAKPQVARALAGVIVAKNFAHLRSALDRLLRG